MKCNWCNKNEVNYELAIYNLKKEKEVVANRIDKQEQLLRNGLYLSVKLCKQCLPVTATNNLNRYKLHGA